jgi:hypothetical protein
MSADVYVNFVRIQHRMLETDRCSSHSRQTEGEQCLKSPRLGESTGRRNLTEEEVEQYISLAEYNIDGGKKGRRAAILVKRNLQAWRKP